MKVSIGATASVTRCCCNEYLEHSRLVVVKKPGANDWSGRGQSSYSPAEFMVLRITEKISAGWMQAEKIIEFPIRKPRSES